MVSRKSQKKCPQKRNDRGITLVEVLIGAAITSLVIGLSSIALKQLQTAQKQANENLAAVGIETVGNRQLYADTRRAGVSYNVMSLTDDSGRLFFDFLPDFNCVTNCSRNISLVPDSKTKISPQTFTLVSTLGGLSAPTAITPITFYKEGTSTLCIGGVGSSCVGGERISGLVLDENLLSQTLTAIDPNSGSSESLVRENQLLLFYSPHSERDPGQNGLPDLNTPPRRMSLVGQVRTVGGIKKVIPLQLPGLDFVIRPGYTGAANKVDTLDKFFKWLPPVGGANAFVLIVPISVIRYRLGPADFEGREVSGLFRDYYDPSTSVFTGGRLITAPVASVDFFRPTISSASVKAKINLDIKRVLGGQ